MIQNYLSSAHIEIISYSQFKSLLNKGLINDLLKVRSIDSAKDKKRSAETHGSENNEGNVDREQPKA